LGEAMHSGKLKIGLVQLNSGARPYLPYVAGLLQAYVQAYASQPERYQFLLPLCEFSSVSEACEQLQGADLVGFSAYVWNIQRSLAIARRLRELSPQTLIVFGGPQVPNQAETFLRENPCIDLCVHGEGEARFLEILEALPLKDWSGLSSLSWLDSEGNFQTRPPAARSKDLDRLPSPYLAGVFEPLMQAEPEKKWAILWETNRGCPFTCSFCDWGSATQSKVYGFDQKRLESELNWFAQHQIEYIFCCDANFGLLKRDLELARYAAKVRQATGFPRALVVQNTKNVTDRAFEVHKILAEAGLDTDVTLSMQSLSPVVLKEVKRQNISLDYYRDLRQRLMRSRIKAYTDMILGLPGETLDSFISGICTLIEHGQYHEIKIYSANILPNAEMADPAYRALHGMQTVQSRTVYLHTPVYAPDPERDEYLELVIATQTLPRKDWVKAKAFGYLVHFLFFTPGVARMALMMLHTQWGIPYRQLFECFMRQDSPWPLLNQIWRQFCAKAEAIQSGDLEYSEGPEAYLQKKWWQPYEWALRHLVYQGLLAQFGREAEAALSVGLSNLKLPPDLLKDCLAYNRVFIQLLHHQEVAGLGLGYNLWEVYQGLLVGETLQLEKKTSVYRKNWRGAPYTLERVS